VRTLALFRPESFDFDLSRARRGPLECRVRFSLLSSLECLSNFAAASFWAVSNFRRVIELLNRVGDSMGPVLAFSGRYDATRNELLQ